MAGVDDLALMANDASACLDNASVMLNNVIALCQRAEALYSDANGSSGSARLLLCLGTTRRMIGEMQDMQIDMAVTRETALEWVRGLYE